MPASLPQGQRPRAPGFALFAALACLGTWLAPAAQALDMATAQAPMALSPPQLGVGVTQLSLPDGGEWTLAAASKGQITLDNLRYDTRTGYAAQLRDKRLQLGLVLMLPENSFSTSKWSLDPCKSEGHLFQSIDSNFLLPQCLSVYLRRSHLANPSGNLYPAVKQWLDAQQAAHDGPHYEIVFTRYGRTGVGVLRAFVPAGRFVNDEAAIAWARQLPPALTEFFEQKLKQASLPALP